MVLTDNEIRMLCNEDNSKPLITPFSEELLQSESYDVTIGDKICVLDKTLRNIDIRDKEATECMYSESSLSDQGYTMFPGEYILVQIKETVNLTDRLTAHIRPKTRFTRLGLLVSDQHCNSTYTGQLFIGLRNVTNASITIYPGVSIAQIVFEELASVPSEEKQYCRKKRATYQNEKEFRGYKVPAELERDVNDVVDFLLGKGK